MILKYIFLKSNYTFKYWMDFFLEDLTHQANGLLYPFLLVGFNRYLINVALFPVYFN